MSHKPKRGGFLARLNPFAGHATNKTIPQKPTDLLMAESSSGYSAESADPLLQRITGLNEPFTINRKRHRDLDEHMDALRPEFVGRPEVCLEVIRRIVLLRRQIDVDENWKELKQLLEKYEDVLIAEMNTRWLLSICDSYADFGTDVERSGAMLIVAFVNAIKLADTERLMLLSAQIDPGKIATQTKEPQPLYDGLTVYVVKTGDMPANMFARIDKTLRATPMLQRIWSTIFQRLQRSENLLSRLAKHHQRGEFFQRPS
jgi:hypothetical protein